MSRSVFSLSVGWIVFTLMLTPILRGQGLEPEDSVITVLRSHEYNMDREGQAFLLNEAANSDFFLLGELHGENEIPGLLNALWPRMWTAGYRHIAAEVSPWAAHQLEFVPPGKGPEVLGLWTKRQAANAHAPVQSHSSVLWGCDMEEEQPEPLIRELASLNLADANLARMVQLVKNGYKRNMAPALLGLANASLGAKDEALNDVSLQQNLRATLQIDKSRLDPDTRLTAQNEREQLMKEQFIDHFRKTAASKTREKVLLRFGRNHLHRGYDARGISTLGNFVAEFAIAQGKNTFNVGAFGAGGKATLMGETWDADERADEPAFELLAGMAKYPATLYDLRPLRQLLHNIPQEKRSALERNLIYWSDSYDALICYKIVTPLNSLEN